MQEGPTFEKMSEADKSLLRRSTVSSIGSHSFLDLDIYSADVHMDKIAEVFLFISLCNPLRWHEEKKSTRFSSVQKPPEGLQRVCCSYCFVQAIPVNNGPR